MKPVPGPAKSSAHVPVCVIRPACSSAATVPALPLPLDLFVAHIIHDETRGYVQRAVGNRARYRYADRGVSPVPQLDLSLPKVATVSERDY